MYLKEVGVNARNWVDAAQDRDYWGALVVAAALKFQVQWVMELVLLLLLLLLF